MKFFILGASGFMGSRCVLFLKEKGYEVIDERVDVTVQSDLVASFKKHKPDVVINFAGVRAYPNIDWCEDNKEETVRVNVFGPLYAAFAAKEVGAYMIQIASGCIYEGGADYEFTENDTPNFTRSFYSRMRISMQNLLSEFPVLQIRIRMPISEVFHSRNLITKIAAYKQVISEPNSVTVIEDMFEALLVLSVKKPIGILNVTNDGYITNGDILEMYKKIVDPGHICEIITKNKLESDVTKAGRSNCVLSNEKSKKLGISMPALKGEKLEKLLHTYKSTMVK